MGMQSWAREMARYNQWQNNVLYQITNAMKDEARKENQALFFGSIHRTLDHILMVDTRLIDMVESGEPPATPFQPERQVFDDYDVLSKERERMDVRLIELADSHDDAWFDDPLTFKSPITGDPRQLPRHFYMIQLFNHATHHRSQVTAALHRQGVDYGSTDLPMNPGSLY